MKHAVVITACGAVTPLGAGVSALWDGLCAGRCGIRPITRFSTEGLAFTCGGEIGDDEVPTTDLPADTDRATHLLAAAVAEAVGDGLPADTGLIAGTNFGGVATGEGLFTATIEGGRAAPGALREQVFQSAVDHVATCFNLRGPRAVQSLSCSSGAAALAQAAAWIRAGRADCVVAGGYDALSLFCWAGLSALRTMARDAVRPFDVDRKGTVFSEGAGVVVLESAAHAAARGATVLATVQGAALNNNAFHMTAPCKDARGTVEVIQAALRAAGVAPDTVDHVNVHGTGTPYNDVTEARALHEVFGARAAAIPVTANKGALGHTMGAAGCLEAIVSIESLRRGLVPPTLHLENQDPACAVDVVTGAARAQSLRTVLSLSAGIGGNNAALVLGHAEAAE